MRGLKNLPPRQQAVRPALEEDLHEGGGCPYCREALTQWEENGDMLMVCPNGCPYAEDFDA